MKRIFFILPFIITAAYSQTKKPVHKATTTPVKKIVAMTSIDSLSYSIGVQVAEYYKMQGVEKINNEYLNKAFNDVFNDKKLLITEEESNMKIQQKLQEFMTKKTSAAKEVGIKFLEENKKRTDVVTLPSGLQYQIITKGTGPIPKATDTVKAQYIGSLIDGTEFDNSYKRGDTHYSRFGRDKRLDRSFTAYAGWKQVEIIYSFRPCLWRQGCRRSYTWWISSDI